ncbi:hypothetical protein KIV56_00300 [Cryobacterium breve]|uniref:Flagellar assembly protein FliH/Type III secretion system HrpE domain-containing protein n=1 Tax=Cryobacterium breve TaxID=1259258 RepID=A0ABY7NC60_9MICO|nr:hypothetical protein KIV56_00300 [Cryobacterium breve]
MRPHGSRDTQPATRRACGPPRATSLPRSPASRPTTPPGCGRSRRRLDRTVGLLTAATHALDERTQPVLLEVEDTLLAAALDLAEAVIGYELSDGVGAARLALRRALDPASPTRPNVVRMHPADLAVIDPTVLAATGVQFQADPSLARGDAVSEFADGFLDARIGTAFERARAALVGGTR